VIAKIDKGNLVITIPLQEPKLSASGKTMVIASTHGTRRTAAQFDGKAVCVSANAFVYPEPSDAEE
jgi:hypothetical protein